MKTEFYFVRHGQTDHNIREGKDKGDHPSDIPLNATGRLQAVEIQPLVAALPFQTICVSPMRRAQETKEILAEGLSHHIIDELSECSAETWKEMSTRGMYAAVPPNGIARMFMDRVRSGLEKVLGLPGPALIVAHGGIHWALCCLLGIETHYWAAKNCAIVHFSMGEDGKWNAIYKN
ncbi:MAG: histidine phosphatase family protein [Verrucomicrobia bacterium]|nr:histidine phosphatase family protein [Verrucomicrobiota bacterium]